MNVGSGQKYRLRELHTEGQGFEGGPEIFSEEVTGKNSKLTNDLQFVFLWGLE